MAPTIRVDEEVFKALQARAEPFVDTPNEVLRRLLELNGRRSLRTVAARKVRSRLAPGESIPQPEFREPILAVLAELGGKGRAADILERVETRMAQRLTATDREYLPDGGDIRWRKKAQWARYMMVDDGLIKSDSPRGIWVLTEKGWQEAKRQS
jgi:hypothetical protein